MIEIMVVHQPKILQNLINFLLPFLVFDLGFNIEILNEAQPFTQKKNTLHRKCNHRSTHHRTYQEHTFLNEMFEC